MEILIRDKSSGRIHRRFKESNSEIMSFEADNADEAGEFEEVDESELIDVAAEAWCKRCFEMNPSDEESDSIN